ncbi:hypothetical protein L798_11803 [Zootermopsis nevadensis]|uniref:Uncharacterized protein n=1 Tax=Zootermopsis nevadensis TaxID=136037 RepID=A0A067R4L7_ZOONE|nr:hypothetical protein L798_11803 [Zootermopsis nevadensis]
MYILIGKPEENRLLRRPRCGWEAGDTEVAFFCVYGVWSNCWDATEKLGKARRKTPFCLDHGLAQHKL